MNLYHYTIGDKINSIMAIGHLRTSPREPLEGETPFVWLSSNPIWENTANKLAIVNGKMTQLDMKGTHELGGGLARFVVEPARLDHSLFSWDEIVARNLIPKDMLNTLAINGIKMGGKSNEWYGAVFPIPIANLPLQFYNYDKGIWENGRPY